MLTFSLEIICSQKIDGTVKKGRQKLESDDVFMADSQDEAMEDPSTTSESEQWSLFEILTPLAERIIQDSVSNTLHVIHLLHLTAYYSLFSSTYHCLY